MKVNFPDFHGQGDANSWITPYQNTCFCPSSYLNICMFNHQRLWRNSACCHNWKWTGRKGHQVQYHRCRSPPKCPCSPLLPPVPPIPLCPPPVPPFPPVPPCSPLNFAGPVSCVHCSPRLHCSAFPPWAVQCITPPDPGQCDAGRKRASCLSTSLPVPVSA